MTELESTSLSDELIEAQRRFCRHLILRTVEDALDLRRWYETAEYRGGERGDYYFRFGFSPRAPKEKAFTRVRRRLRGFICGELFITCCKVSKIDPDNARAIIHQILMGGAQYERVSAYLEELKEVTNNYAIPRGVKSEKDKEESDFEADSAA